MSLDGPASLRPDEDQATKHNITVAVRIRPLSSREILRGEEVAWYADGDTVVRNPNVSYAYGMCLLRFWWLVNWMILATNCEFLKFYHAAII